MSELNKLPLSPLTSFGPSSVQLGKPFGTNFSIYGVGGFMEVFSLDELLYTIPTGFTGNVEYSGNTIPIQFTKGSGSVFSPDVLTLNSDNISSGRRKLGMLVYVYDQNQIYQYNINNYETLWNNATGATGPGGKTVVISNFGTTVKSNTPEGIAFISAWTANTIEGVSGETSTTAVWKKLVTGGGGGQGSGISAFTYSSNTLTIVDVTGGTYTVTINDFTGLTINGGLSATTISGGTFYGDGLGLINIPQSGITNLQSDLNNKFDKSGGTVNGDVIVNGNVTILGTATTINTDTLLVKDNIIGVNSNYTGNTAPFFGNSGIEVLRGSATTATLLWEEQLGYWTAGLTGNTKQIILSGDSLSLLNSGHTHPISEIINLQSSLDNKFDKSGGTISGNTIFTNGITASTISATTYNNLPTYISAVTLSSNSLTVITGGNNSITSIINAATGGTYSAGTITLLGSGVLGTITGLTGTYITSFTYTPSTNTFTINDSSGKTFNTILNSVTGLTINGNLDVTGDTKISGLTTTSGVTSTGSITFPQKFITTSYTATTSDYLIDVISGTNLTITLPDCTSIPGRLYVLKNNYDSQVTVVGTSGQTIDGLSSIRLGETNSLSVASNGNYWVSIGVSTGTAPIPVSTGVYSFSGMSAATSATTFYVSPLKGYVVNDISPTSPTVTFVNFSGGTYSATNVTTTTETWVYCDVNGVINQQNTPLSEQERRQNIFIGKLGHANKQFIVNVFNSPDQILSSLAQFRDLFEPIGYVNGGVYPSPNTGLTMNTSAGYLYGLGINFVSSNLNPNKIIVNGQSPAIFQYRTQTGGTATNTTLIDPLNYDVNGVITPITGTKATNQRIYLIANGQIRIQYGQTTYNQLSSAIAGIATETFNTFSNFSTNGILIGILSILSTATNTIGGGIDNNTKGQIFLVSKFGETVGAAGGLATTTLQQAYNNSSTPEIVINSTLDGLSIKNGTGNPENTTNLLEGIDSSNVITSIIRADGLISGSSISTPSFTANTNGVTANTLNITGNTDLTNLTTHTLNVTGNTILSSLTANTISATTYLNLPYFVSGSTGSYSIKVRNNTSTDAQGDYAFAIGEGTVARGKSSFAGGGSGALAEGDYSFVFGLNSYASTNGTIVLGSNFTTANIPYTTYSQNMVVSGTGTTYPIFRVIGSNGNLFSVYDSTTGTLFSVNNISGLPVFEVLDNDAIKIGSQSPSQYATKTISLTAGTNVIYTIPTSAYTSSFFDYSLSGSSGMRAGNVMSIWSGTTTQYTETSTNDIGSTTGVTFSVDVSGSNARFIGSATTSGWTVSTIIKSI